MGVRILTDKESNQAALYCSTTDWAFGPVFYEDDGHDADERAASFCRYLGTIDPRRLSEHDLLMAHSAWRLQETAQWAAEGRSANDWQQYKT